MTDQPESVKEASLQEAALRGFFGRRREVADITAALDRLAAGSGSLILLRGELGIGKTTLCDETERIAISKGIRVLWARSWEEGGVSPYWLWAQVLRSFEGTEDFELMVRNLGPIVSYFGDLLPRGSLNYSRAESVSTDRSVDLETAEQERFKLFQAVLSLLQKAARDTPLLIIFDDCHAADESSMALLRFVARHLRQCKIMLLLAYREEEIHQKESLIASIGALGREGSTILLRSLSRQNVAELVLYNTGRQVGSASAGRLFESTEGNPFFLKEVLRLATDAATAVDDPNEFLLENLVLPDQLEGTIRLRLEPISEKAKNLLRIAAVDGIEFELDRLLALSAVGEREAVSSLQEAVTYAVVSPLPGNGRRYRFTHGLFARTLYQDLPVDRRCEVHSKLGTLLAETTETQSDALLARIAHHRLRALPNGDLDGAIDIAYKAAQRANASLAYEDAASWYEQILTVVESQKNARTEDQCKLLLGLAESLHRAGRFRQSKQRFEALINTARESRNGEWFARAVLGLGLLPTTPGTVDRTMLSLLEEALALLDSSDAALRARLLAQVAESMQWTDPEFRRVAIAHESVAMARRVGDPIALEDCLYRSHVALSGPDTLDERLGISLELLAVAQHTRSVSAGLRAHYLRLRDVLEIGPMDEVQREVDDYVRIVDDFRQRHMGIAEAALAMRAMIQGRFDDAEKLALEALNLGQNRRDGLAPQAFAAQMTVIRREQGRIGEIEPIIHGIVTQFPNLILARCGLAFCYSEGGRYEDARFEFERLAASGFSAIGRDVGWLSAHVLLAEVCVSLDDRDRAAVLYKLLAPYPQRNASLDMYVYYGPVALYLGMLATVAKIWDEAEGHFEVALQLSQSMDSRPWFARSQHFYARMLMSRSLENDLERAELLNRSSLAIARSLKMKALEQRSRDLAQRFSDSRAQKAGDIQPVSSGRTLSTVLFIDMVGSTELAAKQGDKQWLQTLNRYFSIIRGVLFKFSGREINRTGDGLLAIFNQPGTAIVAARELIGQLASLDLQVRAGVHTGEFEWNGHDVAGIAIHIGARLGSMARGGEILVSGTVKELVVGSGISFLDRGYHSLRGVPGQWQIFQVESVSS
jgi:class 3 adenylate cyclase